MEGVFLVIFVAAVLFAVVAVAGAIAIQEWDD